MSKRLFISALAVLGLALPATAADWKPVDANDLALKTPTVQPDADAEALFWEVRVADEFDSTSDIGTRTIFDHYVRVKVFTERGRETFSTVDIIFETGMDVSGVAARTIRVDGSVVELKNADVYQRTIVRAGDLRQKAVSFAVPAIAAGVIVEYQWREIHHESVANFMQLPFSREIPVRVTRYYIRPLDTGGDFAMQAMMFNGTFAPFERQRDGFTMVSLLNVPADRTEPYAPPPLERRPWVLIYYQDKAGPSTPEAVFRAFSKDMYDDYAKRAKPTDQVRRLAVSAVATAKTRDERIAALMRVVRQTVRRVDVDTADAELQRQAKDNNDVDDVVKRGVGNATDTRALFVALANSSGFEARIAATSNRAQLLQTPGHQHPYFLSGRLVALRDGEKWTFVDPANEHSTTGAVRWNYSGHEALVSDPKQMISQRVPLAAPAGSVKRRLGKFKLSEDGTLEGEWRLEYEGHWGELYREQEDQDALAEREKAFQEEITKRLPGAVVTNLTLGQVDPSRPYVNSYRLRVPGYAQRTGTRLFFQPLVFQKGAEAMFPSTNRTYDVYFRFPWSENDEVTIAIPSGYELEQPEVPGDLDVGVGTYRLSMGVTVDGTQLVTKRAMIFGLRDSILLGQQGYASVKAFFDRVHTGDGHTLVLRRKPADQ